MNDTKKELGQHWLKDDAILQAIVESASVTDKDVVLEIGPGEGTLTAKLAEQAASVRALEFDRDLLKKLNKRFSQQDTVVIEFGDIRTYDFSSLPKSYKVVANIPYYLTSHLIRQFSEADNKPSLASLLVQKEVALRICEVPGNMSTLSLAAQFWYECSLDIEVPAEFFTPPPKVDSKVVVMKLRDTPLCNVDFDKFMHVVAAGFSQKRKKLSNSLQHGLKLNKDQTNQLLEKSAVDGNKRAQHLTFNEWEQLTNAFYKTN